MVASLDTILGSVERRRYDGRQVRAAGNALQFRA
jgi:hypothetical protein